MSKCKMCGMETSGRKCEVCGAKKPRKLTTVERVLCLKTTTSKVMFAVWVVSSVVSGLCVLLK